MKLLYIFLGLIFIGLAGGGFYYTRMKPSPTETKAAVKESAQVADSIYVYREYGDIAFKNKNASTYTPVTDTKMLIANYSSVKTRDGRGYVIFPDNSSIALSSSTEIEINYEPTKVSIMQLLGTTYHRVTSLAKGNKYEIRTPNTLAAIRGTKLAVTYNQKLKKTYVAVTEHMVEVTPTKEDGTVTTAPVIVQEGKLADIQSSTSTTKNSTSTSPASEKVVLRSNNDIQGVKIFVEENKIIDKQYDAIAPENRKELLEKIIKSLQVDDRVRHTSTTEKLETRTETLDRVLKQTMHTTPQTSTLEIEGKGVREPISVEPKTTVEARKQIEPASIVNKEVVTLKPLPIDGEELTSEQEAFINSFYAVYEKYFFIDDPASYCKRLGTISAKEMVASLLAVSNRAGFVLPKELDLSLFAQDLLASCVDGTIQDKAQVFKTRFDVTYPY